MRSDSDADRRLLVKLLKEMAEKIESGELDIEDFERVPASVSRSDDGKWIFMHMRYSFIVKPSKQSIASCR